MVGSFIKLSAQTPTDGLMMDKGYICNVLNYSHGSWSQYWEGTFKRSNNNIGTLTTQSVALMSAYGITEKFNVIIGLPYIWTKSTAGQMSGQSGIQDISLWLKYRAIDFKVPLGTFSIFGTGGVSTPLGKYTTGYLPYSIGLKSKTASARIIAYYETDKGIYATGQAGYTYRGNGKLPYDSYYANGKLYENTSEIEVPNVADITGKLGFINDHIQTEVWINRFTGLSGDNIRRNFMPQASNDMSATSIGWFGKYTYISEKSGEFSVVAEISKVMVGSNVGQTTQLTFGVQHAFHLTGKKTTPPSNQLK